MNVSNYRHPSRQDFPSLSPDTDKALDAMGKQIRELTQVLQGKSSLTENGNNEIRTLKVTHDTAYDLSLGTMKGNPLGAIAIYSSIYEIPRITQFQMLGDKKVRLKFDFLAASAQDVTVRVLFLGS